MSKYEDIKHNTYPDLTVVTRTWIFTQPPQHDINSNYEDIKHNTYPGFTLGMKDISLLYLYLDINFQDITIEKSNDIDDIDFPSPHLPCIQLGQSQHQF